MTPKNMEMGRAGRARRTIPRMRLVIQRPCMEGDREIDKINGNNGILMWSGTPTQGYPSNQDTRQARHFKFEQAIVQRL
jgi:hypothetical protein